jgi:glycosyltransferase involved in cell wall biosynthesis
MSSENNVGIRIVMLAASLPPLPAGGAEVQAVQLSKALIKKGHAVFFVTPGKGRIKGKGMIDGIPVFRLHTFLNTIFEFSSRIKKKARPAAVKIAFDDASETTDRITRKVGLPTIIYYWLFFGQCLFFLWKRRKDFDIIHVHTMEWSAIVAARLGKILRKPVLIKDSTMNGFESLKRYPRGKHLQSLIIENAHFIAMTRVIADNLKKAGILTEKISLIPNGISITAVRKGEPVQDRVIFTGNLYQQPAKGVDILLQAWSVVIKDFPNASLWIIGDGVNDAYMKYVQELSIAGSVKFMGKIDDVRSCLETAGLFVLPSRREGMSNALMEAMLCGLPCVATDISGSRDLIKNGVNGIIVPPANVAKLAEAIGYMLQHREEAIRMGRKAQETIINEFGIDRIAGMYEGLYQTLVQKS